MPPVCFQLSQFPMGNFPCTASLIHFSHALTLRSSISRCNTCLSMLFPPSAPFPPHSPSHLTSLQHCGCPRRRGKCPAFGGAGRLGCEVGPQRRGAVPLAPGRALLRLPLPVRVRVHRHGRHGRGKPGRAVWCTASCSSATRKEARPQAEDAGWGL